MTTKATSIPASSFELGEDGVYVGTVFASDHGLGTGVYLVKAIRRNSDLTLENVLLAYKTESNGDVKVYVEEPSLIRLTLAVD